MSKNKCSNSVINQLKTLLKCSSCVTLWFIWRAYVKMTPIIKTPHSKLTKGPSNIVK